MYGLSAKEKAARFQGGAPNSNTSTVSSSSRPRKIGKLNIGSNAATSKSSSTKKTVTQKVVKTNKSTKATMKERKEKEVDVASNEREVVLLENTNSADTSETTVATDFVISADTSETTVATDFVISADVTCDGDGSTDVVEDAMVIVASESSDDVTLEVSVSTSEVEPDSTDAPELSFSFTTSTDEPEIDLSAELQVNAAFQLTSAETTEVEDEEESAKKKKSKLDRMVTEEELQISADISITEVAEVVSQEDTKHENIESEKVETEAENKEAEEVKETESESSDDEGSVETVEAEPMSKEDEETPQILEEGAEKVIDGHKSDNDDDAKVEQETKTEQEDNLEESQKDNEEEACPKVKEAEGLEADDEEALLKADEEAHLKFQEEARLEAEEEARLKSEVTEEEEKRLTAEKEKRSKAEEAEEEMRLKTEEEARLKAEEEVRLKAEEARLKIEKAEEELRLKDEEEKRLKDEQEARLKAEEEERKPKETEADKAIKKTFIESRQGFQPIPDEFYSRLFYFSGMGTLIGSSLSAGIYVPEETIKCGLNAEQVESCVPETFDKHVEMVTTARTRATELSTELRKLQALLQALPIFTGEGAATQTRRSQSTSHASLPCGTMTHRTRATSYAGASSAHEGLSTPSSRAKDIHSNASTIHGVHPPSAELPSVGIAEVPTVGAHYPFQKPGQRCWMPPSRPTALMPDEIDNSMAEPSPRPIQPQPPQAVRSARVSNNVLSPSRLPPPSVHPKPRLVVTDAAAPTTPSTPTRRPWELDPDSLNVPGRRRARSVITPPAVPPSPVSSPMGQDYGVSSHMGRDYGVFTAQGPSWQDKYGKATVDDQPAPKPFAGGIPITGLKTWQMSRLRALEARGFVVDSEQVYIDQTPARRASADVASSEIGSYAPYLVSAKSRVVDYAAQPMSPTSAKSFKPRMQNGFGRITPGITHGITTGISPLPYCDL